MRHLLPALLLLLSSCSSTKPAPVMGWKPQPAAAVALPVAGEAVLPLPPGRLRLRIEAEQPVTFVVVGHTRENVLTVETEETVAEGDQLLLRDGRTPTDQLLAGAAAVITSNKTQADRALNPNRVNVALFRWECISSCDSSTK